MSCRPGHSPKFPDFTEGNRAAERHGAYSNRKVDPLAKQIEADLPAWAPWAAREAFAPARRRYARAEAVASLLWEYVAEHGPLDADGNPRPALEALAKWESAAANRAASLGFDPLAFGRLLAALGSEGAADAAEALAALQAEGRRIMEARRAALPAGTADHASEAASEAVAGAETAEAAR